MLAGKRALMMAVNMWGVPVLSPIIRLDAQKSVVLVTQTTPNQCVPHSSFYACSMLTRCCDIGYCRSIYQVPPKSKPPLIHTESVVHQYKNRWELTTQTIWHGTMRWPACIAGSSTMLSWVIAPSISSLCRFIIELQRHNKVVFQPKDLLNIPIKWMDKIWLFSWATSEGLSCENAYVPDILRLLSQSSPLSRALALFFFFGSEVSP